MVTISDSTIRANIYETIYDVLNGVTYTNASDTVTVTAAYTGKDEQLPQVVVHPVDVGYSKFSFNRTNSDKQINVLVEVYTKKAKDKDVITDYIMDAIIGESFSGFFLVGVDESNALDPAGMNKIHLKSIAMTFMRR